MISLSTFVMLIMMGMPPCEQEDSINCYWLAEIQGNGEGRSFLNLEGEVYYVMPEGVILSKN